MKVLFISSGNSGKINPIIRAQGKTLEEIGISVSYFLIQGKGFSGYLRNIPRLRKHIKMNNYDVIHAHYSLTAYVATMAKANPLVVSLMGSDVKGDKSINYLLKFFCRYIWHAVIVKSEDMKKSLGYEYSHVIPNGVDIDKFKPTDKIKFQNILGWDNHKFHLLFAADPGRAVKNYRLFEQSVKELSNTYENIETHFLRDVDMDKVPIYMNASDIVCLSSRREGSPNVIKEAMACNRPVVCTNVGDVKLLFQDTEGCFLSLKADIENYTEQLEKAIQYSKIYGDSKGRDRIIALRLDSKTIAEKIKNIYKSVD